MANRTKYVYDGIIVNYMMRKQIQFSLGRPSDTDVAYIEVTNRRVSYTYVDISVSDLCRTIEENTYGKDVGIGPPDGYPEIEYRTVQRHLKKMVKEHVLVKIPKSKIAKSRRPHNETLYKLHPNTLYAYFDYLLTLLTRGKLSTAKKDKLLLSILN